MESKIAKDTKIAVIIIVGSNEISMRISQKSKNVVRTLENLSYSLNLGRDTFVKGSLSFENVKKVCTILKGFLNIVADYGIDFSEVEAIGTTAIREAKNQDYVIDQIRVVTGLILKPIDDRAEKLYNFQLIDYYANESIKKSSIMVNIGSGNVAVLHYEDGKTTHFNTIRIGALRISEVLGHMKTNYNAIIDDYLDNFIKTLYYLDNCRPEYFVASGHEIGMIASLCGVEASREFISIDKSKLCQIYDYIRGKNLEKISDYYDLPIEKVEILIAQVSLFHKLLDTTSAKEILITNIDTIDSFTMNKLYNQMFEKIIKNFNKNNLEVVRLISAKFNIDKTHTEIVEKFALKIFDKMKKIHGMGLVEKKLLSISAILHDIGKFINYSDHCQHSYNIIRGLDITTLNITELEIVANIALYHGRDIPSMSHENYKSLEPAHRVLVSKLTAILRIADSLDKCGESKIDDIEVRIEDEEFIITAISNSNIELEKWVFSSKSKFFEYVFGIKPVLKQKRVL